MRAEANRARPAARRREAAGGVDAVIVAYNSRDRLRETVEPLTRIPDVRVIVVDNASNDAGLQTIDDLPLTSVELETNLGFSAGCNAGWRTGDAPYVLLLNPDASIDARSIHRLVDVLEEDERAGLVGPRIVDSSGALEYSQRRFMRLRSTYARALFLHRLLPHASWTDELVRDPAAYASPRSSEWLSGACLLVRRDLLERIGGLDERFFLYCEDQDLCRAVWETGYRVRYEPSACCVHEGGASAPRASLFAVDVGSRLLYARKHAAGPAVALQWLGLVTNALTHSVLSRGGLTQRKGHMRALFALFAHPPTQRRRH
jgi:N-acetylglucosaminyl-diphospho-decaprenol L-rhamnosyltransferase